MNPGSLANESGRVETSRGGAASGGPPGEARCGRTEKGGDGGEGGEGGENGSDHGTPPRVGEPSAFSASPPSPSASPTPQQFALPHEDLALFAPGGELFALARDDVGRGPGDELLVV